MIKIVSVEDYREGIEVNEDYDHNRITLTMTKNEWRMLEKKIMPSHKEIIKDDSKFIMETKRWLEEFEREAMKKW